MSWLFSMQVLCELQVAMLERGIQPEQDISREIMGSDIRDIEDTSYRNLRDWYIYRYYSPYITWRVMPHFTCRAIPHFTCRAIPHFTCSSAVPHMEAEVIYKIPTPPSVRSIRILTKMLMNISTNLQSWALATTVATTWQWFKYKQLLLAALSWGKIRFHLGLKIYIFCHTVEALTLTGCFCRDAKQNGACPDLLICSHLDLHAAGSKAL